MKDGAEIASVGPGDVLGEMSLLGDQPAGATVVAKQTTLTMFLERSAFEALLNTKPEVRNELERIEESRNVVNAFVLGNDYSEDDDFDEETELYL